MADANTADAIALRNLMRGQGNHRPSRHRISEILLRSDFLFSVELNSFLLDSNYKIDPNQWINFPFDDRDWVDAKKISANKRVSVQENIATLLEHHIILNSETIRRLIGFSDSISCTLLSQPEDDPSGLFAQLNAVDRQSLFFWRVTAAANSYNGKKLASSISYEMRSNWATNRFLYPFVFFSINQPPEYNIPKSLKYILDGTEREWERLFIEYAVGYKRSLFGNEWGFMWLALLSHPFDAIDMLCDILEEHSSRDSFAPAAIVASAEKVAKSISYRRLEKALYRQQGKRIQFISHPNVESIQLPVSDDVKQFYWNLISGSIPQSPPSESDFLNILIRMRTEKYPSQLTYDTVVFSARRWRFTEAGKLLEGFAYLLFMYPRSSWQNESKFFNNLVDFFGGANTLLLMAPGVATAHNRDKIFTERWGELAAKVEVEASAIDDTEDRTWINLLFREVSEDQNHGRVSNWITKVARHSPIKRNYLSGADWSWIEEILRTRKVHPFRGDRKAAYVFLLKGIEQGDPDFGVIRSILRPVYSSMDITKFIEMVISTYDERAAAFSYFFLSPENLLLMEMSVNQIDAMAGRILALEACIKRFGFCEILTEEIYLDEIRALESAISYGSMTLSQFEVPWQSFSNEQVIQTKDLYDASVDLTEKTAGGAFPMGSAETENTISFPNGVLTKFTLPNFKWTSAEVVLDIIKSFIRDPGYGLEAILGTRIRHNVIEREFVGALESLAQSSMPGVFRDVAETIFEHIISEIRISIQLWVDTYMHSLRPDKKSGVFRITPDQMELASMISAVERSGSHREAVRSVVSWLQLRLEEDLKSARRLVDVDMREALRNCIKSKKASIELHGTIRLQDVDSIALAIQSEVDRKVSQVIHWFEWPEEDTSQTVTLAEICSATFGRFASEINSRKLRFILARDLDKVVYPRTAARLMLDIVSEIMMNYLKHTKKPSGCIRVAIRRIEDRKFIVFSNSRPDDGSAKVFSILGERHNSQIEHLLAATGSGLKRIAGSYATALGREESVSIVRRKSFFHVLLPSPQNH